MPLDNFGIIMPGRLYRCAQPDAYGFQDLYTLGVRTVIKLDDGAEYALKREEREFVGEQPTLVIPLEFDYPIVRVADLRIAAATIQGRLDLGDIVAVHCKKGRDRTGGAIAAWRLISEHWSFAAAMVERAVFGTDALLDVTFDRGIIAALKRLEAEQGA